MTKLISSWPSSYCERKGILFQEQSGFRPARSTSDIMFVIRRLHQLARSKRTPLYACSLDLAKACDSINRELPVRA